MVKIQGYYSIHKRIIHLIDKESVVYTSGTGGFLNPGIPIGKIENIENIKTGKFFCRFFSIKICKNIILIKEEKNKNE